MRAALAALALVAAPALAQEADPKAEFVADNLVAVFYHELGHALIDQLNLPVLGKEEDAADILSVLLVDEVWEPEAAQEIVANTAYAYALSAEEGEGDDPMYWDVHGHDMQRYFTHVCLFYGADPENRADFAASANLPEERAATCAEERELADESWWTYLQPLADQAPGMAISLDAAEDEFIAGVISEEIDTLNERFDLPQEITVDIESCGEVNAYYIPDESRILMCTEFADFLWERAQSADL